MSMPSNETLSLTLGIFGVCCIFLLTSLGSVLPSLRSIYKFQRLWIMEEIDRFCGDGLSLLLYGHLDGN